MFEYANFEVVAFEDFDFPVVVMVFIHEVIGVIVFVYSNGGVDADCSEEVVVEGEMLVAMVGGPVEVDEMGIHINKLSIDLFKAKLGS